MNTLLYNKKKSKVSGFHFLVTIYYFIMSSMLYKEDHLL
ncbi:putative membrane protein [Bacillus mycoides]|nr:putative membrane protein [Bacillus mycoides]KZD41445.1 hypothetical protein B4083_1630 [Bacillus cereus]EEK70930.1 hypothetical protein bcere0007_46080 [Bacillus mycoides]KUH44677.1 hypothetical protein M2E15_4548 [Bacillus mycoides]KZE01862.1 hypothetical protein B4117_5793 [Bacillus mycoides]